MTVQSATAGTPAQPARGKPSPSNIRDQAQAERAWPTEPAPGIFSRRPGLDSDGEASELSRAIAGGKNGDPEAIRYLYSRYADDVFGYVSSILRDDHEAEDITQNVFIKLMRILPKYEERGIPFAAWLLRVARNVALDYLRARRMIPCEEVRDPDLHGCDEQFDRDWSLRDALSTLSLEQRRVVVWRHLLGLSPVEIAAELGKTEGSVHALHHRGRRAVQAELRAMGSAPSTMRREPALVLAS